MPFAENMHPEYNADSEDDVEDDMVGRLHLYGIFLNVPFSILINYLFRDMFRRPLVLQGNGHYLSHLNPLQARFVSLYLLTN